MFHRLGVFHRILIPVAVLLCPSASGQGSVEKFATLFGRSQHVRAASADGSVAVLAV
ncbi:MAG: hypothetical protein JKY61_04910 [Planctomycetes bacterium]|nr:hypothetical protein [Planctomycetota bacterium]